MEDLHQIHTMAIVDLNSAVAYLMDARNEFILYNIQESLELIERAKREIESATKNIGFWRPDGKRV